MVKTSDFCTPLWLALATFLLYAPSLFSDFVYDARLEILDEGFITSSAHLPSVLSLKVLGMPLMLGSRPGQLLYLMLIALVSGKAPFGYHLCSNLLHAANVALLYVVLRRFMVAGGADAMRGGSRATRWLLITVTLIFAVHPIATESVAEVSYSSGLLVTFFMLLALLAAIAFRPENFHQAMKSGCAGVVCAFAAVTCKESGAAVAPALVVYWLFYRRNEAKGPWLLFLGASLVVSVAFLSARFYLAPPPPVHFGFIGGSFHQVFRIQPRLWVFMMGKLLWPVSLSADYTPDNSAGISFPWALAVLALVGTAQAELARRSRLGALGVALYWLGLATVSNFVPLFRAVADRFYYLPMVGVAMQLLAALLLLSKFPRAFQGGVVFLAIAVLPLSGLTLIRESVFADNLSLWTDTLRASPTSPVAYYNLGLSLFEKGRTDDAILDYKHALELAPHLAMAQNNLGLALAQKGRFDEAIVQFRAALRDQPFMAEAHANLGAALAEKGVVSESIDELKEALRLKPDDDEARHNLATEQALRPATGSTK